MKVGINDGCAHGGMMDSLSISPRDKDPDWEPSWTVEVTESEWAAWQQHLEEHATWDAFWDTKMRETRRKKR